ncbi:serine/threonine protein kinase [Nocardiopsis sp. Huas11]|uniref:serine/threonine-protein kinase n=1 Tax=Nocardiopsis sp. Huas11 TaxID=2183912 RepID=UPI000EB142F6|nr:serine/threonine-protein kinase [Nocardiopsis sp. Huas11]RKS07895.1 serine/threonine protein kinase [Nocardiopsis sp. Huas11]
MDDGTGEDGVARPSDRVVGDYRLVRSLGRGGFGEVFLGEAPDGTKAAVKLLHASWAGDADMRRRFTAEVEQARRVSGFCIAGILDADPEAAEPWIATEYIDGPTLQEAVDRDGPRTGADLHRLAVSTATALAAIHAAGVVHRDLKPDNIMLAPDGPRVIDFGIARAVESTSVTASGVVGTIGYMAPEQLEGARLTSAVDLFSWGSVMVYAATGQEAFSGPTQASRIARILGGEPDLGALPEPLLGIIRTCLDKDPDQRPDAATLLNRLISAPAEGTAAPAPAPTPAVSPNGDGTALTPRPADRTRIGVDPTMIAGDTPRQVDPTRVAPPAAVDPTRAYTALAAPHAPPVPGAPPAPEGPSAPQYSGAAPSGPPHAGPLASAPYPAGSLATGPHATGGVPPCHFGGVRFTDPRALAEAFQRDWPAALRVFGDAAERAALGAWIINDLGDTTVDRSLFRRQAADANLAIASFVAQLRPDLPPVFRGRPASLEALGQLFADPAPMLTGAPLAGEMALLARPDVLRVMGQHHSGRPGALLQLAEHLGQAERAGIAFHEQLRGDLAGWVSTRVHVNPALVLAFLLHPESAVPPKEGDKAVAEWIDVLWRRVESAPAPESAGCAAMVYGAVPTLRELARQRRHWEERFSAVSAEHDALANRVGLQVHLTNAVRYSRWAILAFPAAIVADYVFEAPDAMVGLLSVVSLLGLIGALSCTAARRVVCGTPARRAHRVMELEHSSAQLPQLTSGVERIRTDLAQARRISGG